MDHAVVRKPRSSDHRRIADSSRAKHSPVAFDFGWRAQRLRVVIGEFDRRPAVNVCHFADQADGIKSAAAGRIAAAKIIGQQRAPTGAETDPPPRRPFFAVQEIGRAAKIFWRRAARQGPPK